MMQRQIPVYEIALAMKEQGATIDECIERFNVPDFRPELMTLEQLLAVRQYTPAANAGQRKEQFLRTLRSDPASSWLPLAPRLRAAVATVAVIAAGTAVASAADPVALVQDIGRAIGIVTESDTGEARTFEIRAVVTRIDAENGMMAVDEGEDGREIYVNDETTLVGASRLGAVRVGAIVEIAGSIEDGRYVASRIEVLERDGSDEPTGTEPEATVGPVADSTPTPESAAPSVTDGEPGGDDGSLSGGGSPPTPEAQATPSPVPALPIPLPALPVVPIDPPGLPNDPLPDLPLPDLPEPGLPLPPLPPLLP